MTGVVATSPEGEATRLFSDPNTRELLRVMLEEKRVLEPDIGGDGRVHYTLAERILGQDTDSVGWISEMLRTSVLKLVSTKEFVMCPAHLRADPIVQVECIKCKSRSSKKASLVEHTYCGYIGDDGKFAKGDILQCPSCMRPIRAAGELRVSGIWYECQNCQSKTSSPKLVFVCKDGYHDFTTADLSLVTVPTYGVNERMISDLRNTLVLTPALAVMLSDLGFLVTAPANAQGQSGAKHALDIFATRGNVSLALQIAVDPQAVQAGVVISFFAKTYDVKPDFPVIVAIPRASEEAKQLTKSYGVTLVEDFDGSEAVQKVKKLLEKVTPK